jgi:hypothetical protein
MDATTTKLSERHVSAPTAVKRTSQSLPDDEDLSDEDHIHWPFEDDLGNHLHEGEELKSDTRRNSGKRNEAGVSRRGFRQSLIPKSSRNRMDRQSPPMFLDYAAEEDEEKMDLWEDEDEENGGDDETGDESGKSSSFFDSRQPRRSFNVPSVARDRHYVHKG